MREFFANLMFTMIISALWSLCFEMPFMTIDNILFSGRKHNLSKLLKTYDSTASGSKEICQSKEEICQSSFENVEEIDVTRDLVRIAKENCENVAECIKIEAEKNIGKIFFINPKHDETWSAVNSNKRSGLPRSEKKSDYINIDLCPIFDPIYRRPRVSSIEKESESLSSDSDFIHRAKSNKSLRDND